MKEDIGPQAIGELFAKKSAQVKPPAYQWQDLALRIIAELGVPAYKKSAVFKVCKNYPEPVVLRAVSEAKELAQRERWRYFFKVIDKGSK